MADKTGRRSSPWLVVLALSGFMALNAADRFALGLAAVPIMSDLHLSNGTFGALGGSFYALFSVSALAGGFLSRRIAGSVLLLIMSVLWAIAQSLSALGGNAPALLLSRTLLGAGEGAALPIALHEAYRPFTDRARPFITGVIASGLSLGVVAASVGLTWLIARAGWRAMFGVLACASLVWSSLWFALVKPRREAIRSSEVPVSVARFLFTRRICGIIMAACASYWLSSLGFVWFPAFLERARGFTKPDTAFILLIAWLLQVPLYFATAAFSYALQQRSLSSNLTRGAVANTWLVLAAIAIALLSRPAPEIVVVPLVTIALGASTVLAVVIAPLASEGVPTEVRGSVLGVIVAAGSLAGVAAPIVMGGIVDVEHVSAHGYAIAFGVSAGLVILSAALSQILMAS